jgi:hypothetical protein
MNLPMRNFGPQKSVPILFARLGENFCGHFKFHVVLRLKNRFNPFTPKRHSGTRDFLNPQNEIEINNPQTFHENVS